MTLKMFLIFLFMLVLFNSLQMYSSKYDAAKLLLVSRKTFSMTDFQKVSRFVNKVLACYFQ